MTSALARDLVDDFYEYFEAVFLALMKLLVVKDGDQVEWSLTCLAHIFKALRRSLKKNFSDVFALILPQLSNEKPSEIVSFLAECFAFITRDLARKKDFFAFVFKSIKDEHTFGCGRLIFEIIHGIGESFHFDAKNVLSLTLGFFLDDNHDDKLFDVHVQIITDVIDNVKDGELVAELLQKTLKESFARVEAGDEWATQQILKLIGQLVEYSRSNLQKVAPILLDCTFSLFDQNISDDSLELVSRLVVVLLMSKKLTISQTDTSRLCKKCLSIRKVSIVAEFVAAVKDFSQFDLLILPDLMKYAAAIANEEVLEIFCTIFLNRDYLWTSGASIEGTFTP